MANRVCELLNCELPIQLAPMGSVAATPSLPLAVAAAGGHGMYPALALPPAALAPVVDALGERTRAFGVNFIVPFMDRASLELAVRRAPYIDFFLADPDPALVDLVHAGGAICGWQVESGREARAAAAAGCDVVIAKAWESGGRKRIEGPTLLPLLDAVLDAVSVPVIAAGGIASARGGGVLRLAGAEIPVARFGAQPPTRESTGAVEAMPFYAGQSAGAVRTIQPAAEIMAELAAGLPTPT